MKKILRISVSLLLMGLIVCASAVTCFAGTVNTLNTTVKNDTVLFYGTVDSETLAVSLMVYDQSGDNLVSIASAAVNDKNEYSIEMNLAEGTYVVKAADYNGGKFLEKTVTVSKTENKNENNAYAFTDGSNSLWNGGDSKGLTFRVNGDFAKFTGVKVDGTLIDAKNYTAVSGSTVITLKTDYLGTLTSGKHTITVVYTDGECDAKFEVKKATSEQTKPTEENKPDTTTSTGSNTKSPQTDDNSVLTLWFALLCVSGIGILGTTVYNRKKNA